MSYNPGFLQQLAGGCQLISCLIMLLLLARLSSEMRCVTAAAETLPSALALHACLCARVQLPPNPQLLSDEHNNLRSG